MSQRDQWKMMHLLYLYQQGPEGRTYSELRKAGIDCYTDAVEDLLQQGMIVECNGTYTLTPAVRKVLQICTVGNKRWLSGQNMWVDYPSAFIIMPFSEDWSDAVLNQMIKPAISDAGLEAFRADATVRVGDLNFQRVDIDFKGRCGDC